MAEGRSKGAGGGQKRFASFLLPFFPYLVSTILATSEKVFIYFTDL